MLVAAAFFDTPERELLWIVAAVMDLSGPVLVGTTGWSVTPAYFVERHGLIIIIALGEAIVGVGAGAEAALARPRVVTAVLLAVLIAAGLWWSYFGYLRGGAERRLRGTTGRERSRLARDSYSYLHLPLVAGWCSSLSGCTKQSRHRGNHSPCCRPSPWPVASRCSTSATSPTDGATTTSSPQVA
ncbi:hypothetical protein GCM10022376_09160 [Yimella lutea]